jgi:hypothetical protein
VLHTLGGVGLLQLLSPLVQGACAEPEGAVVVAAESEIKAFINKDYQFKVLHTMMTLSSPTCHTRSASTVSLTESCSGCVAQSHRAM